MPTTPTVLYSTTRGWNPGDEFILHGVRSLVDEVLGPHNPLIYNRNPELHATRVLFPRIEVRRDGQAPVPVDLTRALKDVVWRYDNSWRGGHSLHGIDYCLFAGTPEWFGPMTAPLVDALNTAAIPVAYLGVGTFEGRDELRFEDLPEGDRELLQRASLITARDPDCARLLEPVGADHLPCPALFSAARQCVREPGQRPRLALNTQGFDPRNPQRLSEPAAGFVQALFPRLAERFDCALICHFADEARELSGWLPGVDVLYSYDARDYADLYDRFELTVTTRVHGAGLCASLGIPGIAIAHSARSGTVAGFLCEQVDVTAATVDEVVHRLEQFPVVERSREIIAHTQSSRAAYRQHLEAFFTAVPRAPGTRRRTDRPSSTDAAKKCFETAFQAHRRGNEEAAFAGYREALALDPEHPGALHCLGLILHGRDDGASAIELLRRAADLAPDNATYWCNLGLALSRQGDHAEAIEACETALRIDPGMREARSHLASALLAHGDYNRAAATYRIILKTHPQDHGARNALGMALHRDGRLDEAIGCYREVIDRVPDAAEAHTNLGFALLAAGRYAEGWPEYAWRRRLRTFPDALRTPDAPRWQGEDLHGRRILVHCEQGLGDTLMFARFVPALVDRGARVLLEVQPPLVRLLESLHPEIDVYATGAPREAFDVHCPLPDLAGLLGITLEDLPSATPYLRAGDRDMDTLRARIGTGDRLTVALVWAGSPEFTGDTLRSPGLDAFSPLLELDHCRFVSLQRDPGHQQLVGHPMRDRILDLYPHLTDMAMTAAAMHCADVVVTSCTAPLHLAGALGRPVLAAIPFAPDWRWLLEREDSPWYPTLRLFRQTHPRHWDDVIERIAAVLLGSSLDT